MLHGADPPCAHAPVGPAGSLPLDAGRVFPEPLALAHARTPRRYKARGLPKSPQLWGS